MIQFICLNSRKTFALMYSLGNGKSTGDNKSTTNNLSPMNNSSPSSKNNVEFTFFFAWKHVI